MVTDNYTDHLVTCPRCSRPRLPASWYMHGYEWLGHSGPCIGADQSRD